MAKTAADLGKDSLTNYNTLGTQAKSQVSFDLAVSGPGIIQSADDRPMAGVLTTAHGAEVAAAVAAAGGITPGQHVSESGKRFKH